MPGKAKFIIDKNVLNEYSEILGELYKYLYEKGGWWKIGESFALVILSIIALFIVLNSIELSSIMAFASSGLFFINDNSFGIALLSGFLIFILVFLGRIYFKETVWYPTTEKESYMAGGASLIYKIFFGTLSGLFVLTFLAQAVGSIIGISKFNTIMLFDYLIFVIVGYMYAKIQSELRELSLSLIHI